MNHVRWMLVITLILLFADVGANMALCACGGGAVKTSWRTSLSAHAWYNKNSPYWGWLHYAIDLGALIVTWRWGHCEQAALRQDRYGSVWAAWYEDWKGV